MREEFAEPVKRAVAGRVGSRCSNPDCRALTSGPQTDPDTAVNVGVAAHITAASPGGPRYDRDLTPDQRSGVENAIWLCQTCGKLVDNDPLRYTADVLREWKRHAEERAQAKVGKTTGPPLQIQLPSPINRVGHRSMGGYSRAWSVKVRLIALEAPAHIVELGVREPGAEEWRVTEIFERGGAGQLLPPIRVEGVRDLWIRAESPKSAPTGPIRVDELMVWVRDVHGDEHSVRLESPEQD